MSEDRLREALEQARDRLDGIFDHVHPWQEMTDADLHSITQDAWFGMEEIDAVLRSTPVVPKPTRCEDHEDGYHLTHEDAEECSAETYGEQGFDDYPQPDTALTAEDVHRLALAHERAEPWGYKDRARILDVLREVAALRYAHHGVLVSSDGLDGATLTKAVLAHLNNSDPHSIGPGCGDAIVREYAALRALGGEPA